MMRKNSTTKRQLHRLPDDPITPDEAVALIDTIVYNGGSDDECAQPLIVLLQGLTYERDLIRRELICLAAVQRLYSRTVAFDTSLNHFAGSLALQSQGGAL